MGLLIELTVKTIHHVATFRQNTNKLAQKPLPSCSGLSHKGCTDPKQRSRCWGADATKLHHTIDAAQSSLIRSAALSATA